MEDFWNRVLRDKENIRFYQAASYSPYSEYSRNWMEEENGITKLSINSFYRYDAIMQPLFGNKMVDKKRREWIFDLYMHYLTELEYRNGATVQEYAVKGFWKQLEDGAYGENLKSIFLNLTDDARYYIAHTLYRQHETRESVDKFTDVLVTVLKNGIVYKDEQNKKRLLFYINAKKNDEDEDKIFLVQQLFMPLGYELRVFWEYHFAVLGEEQTMMIDEIELL